MIKKEGVDLVKDFRQIGLVHSFDKLITKLLVNRLAGRLHDLISLNQNYSLRDALFRITSC